MGFYPYMKGDIERMQVDGKRIVRARVFDSVLSRWIVQDFDGYAPEKAVAWIVERMNQVEM